MCVMTRVVLGNALIREVPLRNHGRMLEYTDQADAKREIEFQESRAPRRTGGISEKKLLRLRARLHRFGFRARTRARIS